VKHTWVTALSVVGVIGAGSAAVLANSTVFTDAARPREAITISATLPPTESTLATVPVADSSTETTVASSVPPEQAPIAAGDAGTVQVTAHDGVITVGDAQPAAGWAVQSVSSPGDWVVVQFVKDTELVVFSAFMVDGQLQTQVDSSVDGAPLGTPTNTVRPNRPNRPSNSRPTATTVDDHSDGSSSSDDDHHGKGSGKGKGGSGSDDSDD